MLKIQAVRSGPVYQKIAVSPPEKKNDIYRYELMQPFRKKWACYNVPLKASRKNGYDVIMASTMLGHLAPASIDDTQKANIETLSSPALWSAGQQSVERSLACFTDAGIRLPVQEYLYTVLLADPHNPYVCLNEGYSGDGGIPGYLFAWLVPSRYTLARLPACLAHEANHNVRYQFIRWRNDITLGEMIVSEGLAENFATHLYGEALAGPWVRRTDGQTLRDTIKPAIRRGLDVQGLESLNAYLYGDEMAALQGCSPVGLPYCAGYACGYHLVRHYLEKTGMGVVEATLQPAEAILAAVNDFWNA